MTDDTNGPAPHDLESDDQFAREPAAAENETWQGGTPEDDFKDDAAAGETATVSEETDHLAEAGNAPDTDKKRHLFLPVVATAGGILLLGVLAYWQFGDALHNDQQPAPLVVTQALKPKPLAPASPTETVAPKTDMAPIAAETPSSPTAFPTEAAGTVTAPPPTTASALPPAAAVTVVPVAVRADGTATESRLASLSARVEDLQKSLDQATQQLSQISGKLATGQTAPAANPSIEERLNGIEQKLMQIQHAAPVTEVTTEESAPQIAMPAMHHAQRKTTHRKTTGVTSTRHAKTNAKVAWVLRAASPNEAWVARDFSSQDLQPVHVGDTLPGIGRVTAIRDDNGSWVVEGFKGTIR